MAFPFFKQLDAMDCGPASLRMISSYYGKHFTLEKLRNLSGFSRDGVSLLGISEAAEQIGFRTIGVKLTFDQLIRENKFPCIIHWNQNHFVVVTSKPSKNWIEIADPAKAIVSLKKGIFLRHWLPSIQTTENFGVVLFLEPTSQFYKQDQDNAGRIGFGMLFNYLFSYKKLFAQLLIGLGIASILQLIFPFLAQSIVDIGIKEHNLHYVFIILLAQAVLVFSRTVVEFIRNRVLLHISTGLNLSILSDFWIKLMRLPISFFDTKMTGDILQRIGDHTRIETFLTNSTLNVLFSLVNLLVFSVVLYLYNLRVFLIFTGGSILYFLWIKLFMKYRRKLDYERFGVASRENSATLQLVQGMQEIKLNSCEQQKRWEWERLQQNLISVQFKSLSISQYQQAGVIFLNEGKNILVTFSVAQAVISNELTLGAMVAIQYIIGQLSSPIDQLIGFTQTAQDAKISLERLNEIHQLSDEEPAENTLLSELPKDKSIAFHNMIFSYPGAGNEPVLNDINLLVPEGKITALVGMSGSGKTTILKLLLRFYELDDTAITIGGISLNKISPKFWRRQCGIVMQEGFIFSDTIAKNISISEECYDESKLIEACEMANIYEFIKSLPLGFDTIIGSEGNGISAGQKQRILIARAIYKNPEFILFDEATNALDANNEKLILENLSKFFKGKTVVVVAHRLSTVKNADQIVVLADGRIVEAGDHQQLIERKGDYYNLVQNQIELGLE